MSIIKTDLTKESQGQLTRQSYEPKSSIQGVTVSETRVFTDDGGSLTELGRLDRGRLANFPEFEARQINLSQVLPGAIKAFHLHLNQDDIWYVPPTERLLVVLTDQRQTSPTVGQTTRFVLGAGKSQLVYIPRGVAHGIANLWTDSATMIYFVNQHFDLENPDEHRLPWDFLGKDIWEIARG